MNTTLEVWKNIPPQTIALLIFILFLSALLSRLPRNRRNHRETPSLEKREERTAEPLTREEQKGQRGEDMIETILYDTVPGEFQVFRNVYVPYRGKTSEIDLLMVHERGVFVFESKNYSGWIFGSMDGLNWMQRFPNGEKHSFYNPVRQNRNHIKALSEYLSIPDNFFYSYVVFSDRCAMKKIPESTRSTVITQTSELEEALRRTFSHANVVYRPEEIQAISDRLVPLTQVDSEVKAKHIEDIRNAQESNICPFCGQPLVLRESRYGSFFWGCSSYPRCKFTRNVTL